MNADAAKETSDDIRQNILDAARQRFAQFGYNKTTMAEIAQDCDMSAANLYRYFKNKLDLGANLACGCLGDKVEQSQEIIRQQDRPAQERLRDVVFQILHYTHGQWSENPRMTELVNAICDARMDIVSDYKQNEHALLVELLEDGIQRGEFKVADVDDTASAIATSITSFSMPLLMPLYSIEVFEQKAESVVRLMLNGLLKT
jgi:AcrR family transcriptional regulator